MKQPKYIQAVLDQIAASGLSDAEVCRRAGLNTATLVRIRAGTSSPTIRTLELIERALGESPAAEAGQ
ncbi:MAG: helix-turn-helix transcriptional regulator [Methyloceanibacter sp.]|nr:helix-turn-helix transcriptional regulator [Methyloceanibacter sp.]